MSNVDIDDPVAARIARILDVKRRDNAEVLSALKVAEDAWERLNKEVDTTIGQEFDLLASERDAVLAARDRLETPDAPTAEFLHQPSSSARPLGAMTAASSWRVPTRSGSASRAACRSASVGRGS